MFFLKSLIFTVFSPSFYVEAVKKGVKKGIGVYLLFTLLVTLVSSLVFAFSFGRDLLNLPETLSDIPQITIENGTLSVDPSQPYEFTDEGSYFAIDPTGEITEIPQGYNAGVLLVEDGIIIRSEDAYGDQTLTYDQVLNEFGIEMFYLDHEKIATWVQSFGTLIIIVSPVFIFIGQALSRIIAILFIAALGFVALCALEQEDCFRKSFLIALYASIPVTYINVMQGLIGKGASAIGISFSLGSICCLIPLLFSLLKWGIFWGLGAYGLNKINGDKKRTPEVPSNGIKTLENADRGIEEDQGE